MNVRVKLFALTQDLAGTDEVSLELPADATVADVRSGLATLVPALEAILVGCAFAVNNEYATNDAPVNASDEIACLPPVSGG
ncbi:molybdopterin converting factor subunit 1 [Bremerella sp. JC817]|uniref:molybdopterin converting factor subunit 1 n=1 Tax=Bremerella sp. JC817 TaxID=3231756 RepID=UPI003459E19E